MIKTTLATITFSTFSTLSVSAKPINFFILDGDITINNDPTTSTFFDLEGLYGVTNQQLKIDSFDVDVLGGQGFFDIDTGIVDFSIDLKLDFFVLDAVTDSVITPDSFSVSINEIGEIDTNGSALAEAPFQLVEPNEDTVVAGRITRWLFGENGLGGTLISFDPLPSSEDCEKFIIQYLGSANPEIGEMKLDLGSEFGNQLIRGTAFGSVNAVSKSVPESSSAITFLAFGTLGAASTLKRKLKSSKSAEKELEKVS